MQVCPLCIMVLTMAMCAVQEGSRCDAAHRDGQRRAAIAHHCSAVAEAGGGVWGAGGHRWRCAMPGTSKLSRHKGTVPFHLSSHAYQGCRAVGAESKGIAWRAVLAGACRRRLHACGAQRCIFRRRPADHTERRRHQPAARSAKATCSRCTPRVAEHRTVKCADASVLMQNWSKRHRPWSTVEGRSTWSSCSSTAPCNGRK